MVHFFLQYKYFHLELSTQSSDKWQQYQHKQQQLQQNMLTAPTDPWISVNWNMTTKIIVSHHKWFYITYIDQADNSYN